jgi:hypothetical protein
MLKTKERPMSAFMPESPLMTRSPIRAVLLAGAGEVGVSGLVELLDRLSPLRCPIIACIRNGDIGALQSRIDGVDTRWATERAELDAAALWIAPPNQHTFVRNGRFLMSGADDTSPAEAPSLGKLYHSLRVDYGSRVFAVVIDAERPNTPPLRLLAQRGARVVSPIDCGPEAVALQWTNDEIVNHLHKTLASDTQVAVA